jgi:hypothetical protein
MRRDRLPSKATISNKSSPGWVLFLQLARRARLAGPVFYVLYVYVFFLGLSSTVTKVNGLFQAPSPDVSDQTFPGPEYDFFLWAE